MNQNLEKICNAFQYQGELKDLSPYGEGHINSTFKVETTEGRYILQKVNNNVFKRPTEVMENIDAVTGYLTEKIKARGGDPTRETLTLIPTAEGKKYYVDEEGQLYRMYLFVENAVCYQIIENEQVFYEAAAAFAAFQKELADFDASVLYETIEKFHDTGDRYQKFLAAVEADKVGRLAEVEEEVAFVKAREADTTLVTGKIASGELPLRVTHNDTKLNNVMIDSATQKGICVIDLDTVMPGSLLYDFGDSIRFGASSAAEDETDLEKVYMKPELFEAYVKGYLEVLGDRITKEEQDLLPFSAKLLTFECGMRFLTDYLDGDNYFKIHYPQHNLDRARNQFKLVADMEAKMDLMKEIVAKYAVK